MNSLRLVSPIIIVLFWLQAASAQTVDFPSEIPLPPNASQESAYQLPGKLLARYMVSQSMDEVKNFYNSLDQKTWKAAGDWSAGRRKFNKADGGKHSFSVTLTEKGDSKTLAVLSVSM